MEVYGEWLEWLVNNVDEGRLMEISNPVRVSAEAIDVTLDHPDFGAVRYTCKNNSGEEEMQAIWDALMASEYGPIADVGD